METIEVARDGDDKRHFTLGEHGAFRLDSRSGRKATLEVQGGTVDVSGRGIVRANVEFNRGGTQIGSFVSRGAFKRGATLELDGTSYDWDPDGRLQFVASRDGTEVARFKGRTDGATVTVADGASPDDLLLAAGAWLAVVAAVAKRRRRRNAAISGAAGSGG